MSFLLLVAIALLSAFFFSKFLTKCGSGSKNLPRGSLGYPIIGETLSFVLAQREGRGSEWVNERVLKYGKVFKTSLLGSPMIVVLGQAGNKFVLGARVDLFAAQKPVTVRRIGGRNNLFQLKGTSYKLLKGALMNFLKPESLQNYVKKMDDLAKIVLLRETKGKDEIKAVVTMKKLTFYIACNILFGIEDELTMDAVCDDFTIAFKAIWSLPVHFPATLYWKGLRARSRAVNRLLPIPRKRKEELAKGTMGPGSDVLTCMLSLRDENQEPLPDDMIMDNVVTLMIGSHDTSATLLCLMIWKLAKDPEVYKKVLEEQLEIKEKNREGPEDKLQWADIQRMKYTWQVAQEMMRMFPPVFGISLQKSA